MLTHHPKQLGTGSYGPKYGRSPFPYDLQTAMFGEPHLILPKAGKGLGTIALPVASHECPECTVPEPFDSTVGNRWIPQVVTPVLGTDGQTWNLYPCHLSECGCCMAVGTLCERCGNVDDHCDCAYCGHCDEKFNESDICSFCRYCSNGCDCYHCATCEKSLGEYPDYSNRDGDYYCSSCYDSYRDNQRTYLKKPGWEQRGWTTDRDVNLDSERAFRKKYAKVLDPAQMMCDFYITDYVTATVQMVACKRLPAMCNGAIPAQTVRKWAKGHAIWQVARDAKTVQDSIIARCDEAFRHYAYMAIGGEVRHHSNVSDSNPAYGRSNTWTWFAHMGDQYGRIPMIQDAIALFEDNGAWNGGYGGEKWAECARILLARETGDLDPKTFVDRVFTLQHHGGSFLNKVDWLIANDSHFSTSSMQRIGNAHSADSPDFGTLLSGATEDVRGLLEAVSSYVTNENDAEGIRYGLSHVAHYRPVQEDETEDETVTYSPTDLAPFCTMPVYDQNGHCGQMSPNGAWTCLGHKGHGGQHVAYYSYGEICSQTDGIWS